MQDKRERHFSDIVDGTRRNGLQNETRSQRPNLHPTSQRFHGIERSPVAPESYHGDRDSTLRIGTAWRLSNAISHLLSSNAIELAHNDNGENIDLSPEQRYDAHVATGEEKVRYEVRIGVFAGFVRYSCTCSWSRSTRIPCVHAVRVSPVYRENCHTHSFISQNIGTRIALEAMFHPHWSCTENDWPLMEIMGYRERISRACQDRTLKREEEILR